MANPNRTSGHYDFSDFGTATTCAQRAGWQDLRLHRYTHATQSRNYVVALELKRPDEEAGAAGDVRDTIAITLHARHHASG